MNNLSQTMDEKNQADYIQNVCDLRRLLNATQKQITVEISDDELANLKENEFSLCFAKKVGDYDYNVIWKSQSQFLSTNEFSWEPLYRIFGTNTFQDKVKVKASTNIQDIGLGEIVVLDTYGRLSSAVTGGDSKCLNVDNKYGSIHFAISQVSVNERGEMESSPIYVSKSASVLGEASFQPVEKVQIWFQNNAETGTMFAELRSNAIEIDLTNKTSASVRYENGKWAVV